MVDADYTGQLGGEGRRNTRIPQLHYLTEKGLKILQWQAIIIIIIILSVLRIRIRDPMPFRPLCPASGMGSGSGMKIPDHISENSETNFLG